MQNKQAMYALALGLMGFIATGDSAGLPRTAEAASPLAPASASAASVNRITSVDVTPAGDVTKITVTGTLPFTPDVQSMARPSSTVITVGGAWSAGMARYTDVRKNDVLDVRAEAVAESRTPSVRIVANTRGVLVHAVRALTPDKTRWEIVVGSPKSVQSANPVPVAMPVAVDAGVARLVADLARPTTKPAVKTGPDAASVHAKMAALQKPAVAIVPPAPVAAVLPAALPAVAETKVAPVERRVSLDFVGADIADVLKALSLQSGLNVVAGSDVKGAVTVTLKNVPMLEALDMVTRLSGFRYAKVGSTYIVGTGASIASLSRSASAQQAGSAAISFYYSDGPTLEKSILQAFPNLNISRVDVGADAKANGGGLIPGGNLNGVPAGTSVVDPATGAVVQGAVPGSTASINQNSGSRFGPRGGVLNVVGTPDEIAAVRAFVDSTEEGLVTSARRQQDAENKVLAGLKTETYKLKYASPSELAAIVNRLVPSLQIQAGPTQAFQPRTLNGSASFSTGPGATGASPAGATAGSGAGGNTGAASTGATPLTGPVAPSLLPPTLLLTGTQADIDRARQILEQNDTRAPQMQFEAKVVDINSSDVKQLGLRYDFSRVVNFGEQNNTPQGTPPTVGAAFNDPLRKPNFGTFYRSPYSITAALDALENDNKARVLARPNLSAMDGQSATVFIGDQIKYVVNIQNTTTGQNITTETATVGITLKVTGKASPDGTITLYVHPEVSAISSYLTLGNGIALPQIATRFVDTTIRVKNGETVGIGGLIREDDIKNIQKVPILGDIPFFGQLFRSTDTRKIRSEVIIFITSRVLQD